MLQQKCRCVTAKTCGQALQRLQRFSALLQRVTAAVTVTAISVRFAVVRTLRAVHGHHFPRTTRCSKLVIMHQSDAPVCPAGMYLPWHHPGDGLESRQRAIRYLHGYRSTRTPAARAREPSRCNRRLHKLITDDRRETVTRVTAITAWS